MVLPPARLRRLVGDLRQVGSVRRVVMADGLEAGVEALVFSTGGGLDFWVTAGRMLDIATLSWRGVQLGWQSPAGFRLPPEGIDPERRFNAGFGGFLNTCGFDHIRQPAGGHSLHGSAPFTPARLTGHGEDWDAEEPVLFCEGEIVAWAYGAGGYRLRRRIEAPIGGRTIRLRDTVDVVGAEALAVLALYHFNLGFPAIDETTRLFLDGRRIAGPLELPSPGAPGPSVLHEARGEWASCCVTGGEIIEFRWRTDALPWLQLWQDLRPGCGVLSVEPCSAGRRSDGSNEVTPLLAPGEKRSFAIDVVVGGTDDPATNAPNRET
ncbi:DUF4432 domain-containing protein [Mesorhizobium sp. L-8-10]|uniref:DUF4432 family protein n=1 Tax=Mesorhizobium sp. L-8-10 TaxID=2744523 RepID=UPI0019253896|nr:DUF4432 family protein [Mesorhizobium sp. L-8-10]BCH35634.1 DUF4432 domain-containing protein [Mesorhizobium sp. L-8-10]